MSPIWTFIIGLILLILFGWYLATELGPRKRILGTVLTLLLAGFCLFSSYPPNDIKDATGKVIERGKLQLGLDLQGGTSFLIRLVKEGDRSIDKSMVEQAVGVIDKRVNQFGVSEPVITPQGEDRILVQIPGLDPAKIQEARQQLQKVAKLEFRLVHPQSDSLIRSIESGSEIIPPGYRIEIVDEERNGKKMEEKLLVRQRADLLGDRVSKAYPTFDQRGWGVGLEFDSQGADQFGKLTAAHVKDRFAIVLDGKVQSAPVIQDAIYGGHASITGRFGEKEARSLASVLENPLQTPVAIEEERSASSTLGADAIKSGVYAGLGGLALVLIFVMLYYRFAGIVAILGLVVNIILLIGALTMFNFVLTLPGIAGIILTIGIAVDASVLIYERLREEMALGKSLRGHPSRLRQSVQLHLRCQRHDADHRGDPVLESERTRERLRDHAHHRHHCVRIFRNDRHAHLFLVGSRRRAFAHDAQTLWKSRLGFSRQTLSLDRHLAHRDCDQHRRICHSRGQKLRHRFQGWRPADA